MHLIDHRKKLIHSLSIDVLNLCEMIFFFFFCWVLYSINFPHGRVSVLDVTFREMRVSLDGQRSLSDTDHRHYCRYTTVTTVRLRLPL